MKKDIPVLKVTDVIVAIVPRPEEDEFWDVYLVNDKEFPILSVIINSTGYGEVEGEKVKTSTMRYFYDEVPAKHAVKIEPIMKNLLSITNEFWVSFSLGNYLYDKRYIFVEGSLSEMNFTSIPIVGKQGVMIK